jgi:hypothetical protein
VFRMNKCEGGSLVLWCDSSTIESKLAHYTAKRVSLLESSTTSDERIFLTI